MGLTLARMYHILYGAFGPQQWWPAKTPVEVMVGAILTQNTNWQNVEKAIAQLQAHRALTARRLTRLPRRKLAVLIRSSGYFNLKAARLKEFMEFFMRAYRGNARRMSRGAMRSVRQQLLSVKGIGPETADSILLYALKKPVFVIDAYTKRILGRHGFLKDGATYEEAQKLFMKKLKNDVQLFNEFHALLVKLGKDFCLKSVPRCARCPLGRYNKECR